MHSITCCDIPLWQFELLTDLPGLRHFVSGRLGGVSSPPYDALNLGLRTADDPANVQHNRQRLFSALGVAPENVASCMQVHGNGVVVIRTPSLQPSPRGRGRDRDQPATSGRGSEENQAAINGGGRNDAAEGDALVTNAPGVMLMLMMADCVPVLISDPIRRVAGVAHAGWSGTVQQVTAHLVRCMTDDFGCEPRDLRAGIGPSIGPCCYEVSDDVIARVRSSLPEPESLLRPHKESGKAQFDLWRANHEQLRRCGVPEERIEVAAVCTRCNRGEFFSDRAQRPSGRFGAGVMVLPD